MTATTTAPRTWSTREVEDLIGRRVNGQPQRLFPHKVPAVGSGHRLRHSRVDVAGALIYHALDPDPQRERPAWHREMARTLAGLAEAPMPVYPWAVIFPRADGPGADWRLVAPGGEWVAAELNPPRISPGPLAVVLFLDLILAPLDQEARRHG